MALVAGTVWLLHKPRNPLSSFEDKATYALYYPAKMPKGYWLKSPATFTDATLFYTLQSDDNTVTITEQSMPKGISSMRVDGFNSVATEVGTLLVGNVNNVATGFVSTETTLVSLRGSTSSQEALMVIAKSLQKL